MSSEGTGPGSLLLSSPARRVGRAGYARRRDCTGVLINAELSHLRRRAPPGRAQVHPGRLRRLRTIRERWNLPLRFPADLRRRHGFPRSLFCRRGRRPPSIEPGCGGKQPAASPTADGRLVVTLLRHLRVMLVMSLLTTVLVWRLTRSMILLTSWLELCVHNSVTWPAHGYFPHGSAVLLSLSRAFPAFLLPRRGSDELQCCSTPGLRIASSVLGWRQHYNSHRPISRARPR